MHGAETDESGHLVRGFQDDAPVAVDSLGEFVEVETDAQDAGISDARNAVRALLADVGLDPGDHVRTASLELTLGD